MSQTQTDAKQLARKILVYGLGGALLKVSPLVLMPIYTRHLGTEQYGVVGMAVTVSALLGILFPLGLQGAATRYYHHQPDARSRQSMVVTLWLAITLSALVGLLFFELFGESLFRRVIGDIPFDPYLRLAVWVAFAQSVLALPMALMHIQERAVAYVTCQAVSALLVAGATLLFVVAWEQGAAGYLWGSLVGTGVAAVLWTIPVFRNGFARPNSAFLRKAMSYSLPIVPHTLATWLLVFSDRLILEHFRPTSEVGTYFTAFQIASGVMLIGTALNQAWSAFLQRVNAESPGTALQRLAPLSTYFVGVLVWAALGLSVLAGPVVRLLVSPDFYTSAGVVPVLALSALLSGLYYLPANRLFLATRTVWIPIATVLAGLANIGANFLLIPSYGMVGAAFGSVIANAVLLVVAHLLAQRTSPGAYEWGRLAKLLLAAGLVWGGHMALEHGQFSPWLSFLLALAFPIVLCLLGFLTPAERERVTSLWRRVRGR